MRIRREYKINTLDIDKNKGIGISVPFNPITVFNITYTTKDQVKSNLINYFLTNTGERYFNPEFGANLRNLLFQQIYNTEELQELIKDRVRIYFPAINIIDLTVTPNHDDNAIKIKLAYEVNNNPDNVTIEIV